MRLVEQRFKRGGVEQAKAPDHQLLLICRLKLLHGQEGRGPNFRSDIDCSILAIPYYMPVRITGTSILSSMTSIMPALNLA